MLASAASRLQGGIHCRRYRCPCPRKAFKGRCSGDCSRGRVEEGSGERAVGPGVGGASGWSRPRRAGWRPARWRPQGQQLEGTYGHRKLDPLGADGIGHPGVLPVPETALLGAKILLYPAPEAIPGNRALPWLDVRKDAPQVLVVRFPAGGRRRWRSISARPLLVGSAPACPRHSAGAAVRSPRRSQTRARETPPASACRTARSTPSRSTIGPRPVAAPPRGRATHWQAPRSTALILVGTPSLPPDIKIVRDYHARACDEPPASSLPA